MTIEEKFEEQSCLNCYWYRSISGTCHRFPPNAHGQFTYICNEDRNDYCGEWDFPPNIILERE